MFEQATILDIRAETEDCVSVSLGFGSDLEKKIEFQPGQYLTFKTSIDGEEIRRSYSICSSPLEKELRVAIKKVPFGKFSTFANQDLMVGDTIEVMGPSGRFGKKQEEAFPNNAVAFAAGSGITPVLSLMKTILETQPDSQFCLIYGNKNRSSIIFKSDIEDLKNKYIGRVRVYNVLSRESADAELFNGRIDTEKCRLFLDKIIDVKQVNSFYICGPEQMTNEVRTVLEESAVPKEKIHFELFGVQQIRASVANQNIEASTLKSQITLQLDGSSFQFEVPFQGESILDAALRNSADLPFACKGGVCSTCRCKVIEGEVDMSINYALEPDEVAQGFVLACQAHPRSEKVVIDFDIK